MKKVSFGSLANIYKFIAWYSLTPNVLIELFAH